VSADSRDRELPVSSAFCNDAPVRLWATLVPASIEYAGRAALLVIDGPIAIAHLRRVSMSLGFDCGVRRLRGYLWLSRHRWRGYRRHSRRGHDRHRRNGGKPSRDFILSM